MTGIRRALPPLLLAAAALACTFALERSLACPIQAPPQPLRTLYKLSERVVVARVGTKEVLEKDENEYANVRVTLHVTENVKGTPVKVVHFYHDEYVGKDVDEDETETIALSGRRVPQLKSGERYLFFLDPREEGGGYEINDESYGIKELSDEGLKVYLERMKELAEITRQEPENKLALVEWLVRCAEEPATRWEGAYELLESAEAAPSDDDEERAPGHVDPRLLALEGPPIITPPAGEAQPAPEPQASDASGAAVSPEAIQEIPIQRLPMLNGFRYTTPDPALVPLLNAVQKQRLADALVASNEPGEGDDLLIQLVKDFGDPRFPGFVLARLHRFEEEAPLEAEAWLRALADALKNEQIDELADSYTQNTTYYEDEEETEASTQTVEAAAADGAAEDKEAAAEEVEETPEEQEAEAAREAAATERATRKRSAMLKALLARIDLFVATGQLASAGEQ